MRAVILAGGRGTRLAPYTTVLPKPLLPVGERPVLELILRQLVHSGITTVDLCVGHLGELIRAYFSENSHLPPEVELRYHWEDEPLGTVGALRQIERPEEPFLMVNGDVLATLDYPDLIRSHRENGAALTMAIRHAQIDVELGVVEANNGFVTGFDEKPTIELTASAGINVCQPSVLDHLPVAEGQFDFPELVEALLKAGEQIATYKIEGSWFDIGTFGEYEKARAEAERHPELFG